jgi:membrane protein
MGTGGILRAVERLVGRLDRFQQRWAALAVPVAVLKKFADDQAGIHAAILAYYGFFSLFPLLLVLVSVLGIVLAGHPGIRARVLDTALAELPVVGAQIRGDVGALRGSPLAIGLGSAMALWAGLRVAEAAQQAMNTLWNVPRAAWPGFVGRRLRAAAMVGALGAAVLVSSALSGLGASGGDAGALARAAGSVGGLLLNLGLFAVAYRLLVARPLRWRTVLPGAAVAAVAWTALQSVGGYLVARRLQGASDVYGTFAVVLGLLVWLSLGAQVALLGAEVNVVLAERLWPRSLAGPPRSPADRAVHAAIVARARARPEVGVAVTFDAAPEGAPGAEESAGSSGGSP